MFYRRADRLYGEYDMYLKSRSKIEKPSFKNSAFVSNMLHTLCQTLHSSFSGGLECACNQLVSCATDLDAIHENATLSSYGQDIGSLSNIVSENEILYAATLISASQAAILAYVLSIYTSVCEFERNYCESYVREIIRCIVYNHLILACTIKTSFGCVTSATEPNDPATVASGIINIEKSSKSVSQNVASRYFGKSILYVESAIGDMCQYLFSLANHIKQETKKSTASLDHEIGAHRFRDAMLHNLISVIGNVVWGTRGTVFAKSEIYSFLLDASAKSLSFDISSSTRSYEKSNFIIPENIMASVKDIIITFSELANASDNYSDFYSKCTAHFDSTSKIVLEHNVVEFLHEVLKTIYREDGLLKADNDQSEQTLKTLHERYRMVGDMHENG